MKADKPTGISNKYQHVFYNSRIVRVLWLFALFGISLKIIACTYFVDPSSEESREGIIETWKSKEKNAISEEFFDVAAERVGDRQYADDPSFIGPMIYEAFVGTGIRHSRCGLCHFDVEKGTFQGFIETETDRINPFTEKPYGRIEAICTSCHRSLHLAHPVGIIPNPEIVILPPEARGFRGEEDRLTCLGCHNHHPINKNYKYLRWSTDGGKNKTLFCRHCHLGKNLPDPERVFARDDYYEQLSIVKKVQEKGNPVPEKNPYFKRPKYEITQLRNSYQGATRNLDQYNEEYHIKKMLTDAEWSKIRAKELFQQGQAALKQGDAKQAIRDLELAKEAMDDINQTNEAILFALGKAYIMDSRLDEAKTILNKMLLFNQDHPEAHFELGIIHRLNGKTDDAIYHFIKAIKIRPSYSAAYLNLGGIYLKDQKTEKAREMLKKTIQLKPDSARAYIGIGQINLEAGQHKEAKKMFQKAIKYDFNSVDAMIGLGECFLLMNDYQAAINIYKEALSYQDIVPAYLGLGRTYLKLKKTEDALKALTKASNLDEKNPAILYNIGLVYVNENLLDKSYKIFMQALELRENYAEVRYEIGKIYLLKKQYKESEESLKKALSIRPDYAQAYIELGHCYYQSKELSLAINAYKKAIQLRPDYSEILKDLEKTLIAQCDKNNSLCIHLGNFYLSQKKYKKAAIPFQRVIKKDPQKVRSYLGLGKTQMKLKNYPEALSSLKAALKLNPNSPEVLYCLGMLFKNMGNEKEWRNKFSLAIVLKYLEDNPGKDRVEAGTILRNNQTFLYQTAIKINPEDPDAHNSLGTSYMVEGKLDQAVSEYERALELRPDYPDYLYNIGLAAGSANNYKKAQRAYLSLLNIVPDHFQARYNLGKLYLKQGMLDKTIAEYRIILPHRPRSINISLGHIYLKRWENEKKKEWLVQAKLHFEEALAGNEKNVEVRENLAFIRHLLSGKIQTLIINTPNYRKIKKIARKIKKRMSPQELKAITRQYSDEAKLTFSDEETLGKKLWKNLNDLKNDESSAIIFHNSRYYIFYRVYIPPEKGL